jgi:hypothetical protein
MDHLDYYTVMESRIKYYSQKYDPLNKLEKRVNPTLNIIKTLANPPARNIPIRNKILVGLDSVISFFL